MRACFTLLVSIIISLSASKASAESTGENHFFAGARTGIELIKPLNWNSGGGLALGLEGGMSIANIGNASLSLMTCGFDSYTQIFHYMFGFSREIIWHIAASGFLGIQRYTTESDAPAGSHAAASGFAYGFGLSYLFPELLDLGETATVQLIPEAIYFKGSDLRWYGGVINFRFNFLK